MKPCQLLCRLCTKYSQTRKKQRKKNMHPPQLVGRYSQTTSAHDQIPPLFRRCRREGAVRTVIPRRGARHRLEVRRPRTILVIVVIRPPRTAAGGSAAARLFSSPRRRARSFLAGHTLESDGLGGDTFLGDALARHGVPARRRAATAAVAAVTAAAAATGRTGGRGPHRRFTGRRAAAESAAPTAVHIQGHATSIGAPAAWWGGGPGPFLAGPLGRRRRDSR